MSPRSRQSRGVLLRQVVTREWCLRGSWVVGSARSYSYLSLLSCTTRKKTEVRCDAPGRPRPFIDAGLQTDLHRLPRFYIIHTFSPALPTFLTPSLPPPISSYPFSLSIITLPFDPYIHGISRDLLHTQDALYPRLLWLWFIRSMGLGKPSMLYLL